MAEDDGDTPSRKGTAKKPAKKASKGNAEDSLKEVMEKIAEMSEPDRGLAERLHAVVMATAPDLTPRLWYGMPAYAWNGKVICFFQAATKFKVRYATLGFMHDAHLDDGAMWPTAFALVELNESVEKQIVALLRKALS